MFTNPSCTLIMVLLPPYFSPYFVPYTCKISTRRSAPSKHLLSRDVVPFNRNVHKSKLHFDNGFAASGPLDNK